MGILANTTYLGSTWWYKIHLQHTRKLINLGKQHSCLRVLV